MRPRRPPSHLPRSPLYRLSLFVLSLSPLFPLSSLPCLSHPLDTSRNTVRTPRVVHTHTCSFFSLSVQCFSDRDSSTALRMRPLEMREGRGKREIEIDRKIERERDRERQRETEREAVLVHGAYTNYCTYTLLYTHCYALLHTHIYTHLHPPRPH